jgi:hypothetical protein
MAFLRSLTLWLFTLPFTLVNLSLLFGTVALYFTGSCFGVYQVDTVIPFQNRAFPSCAIPSRKNMKKTSEVAMWRLMGRMNDGWT